jgi:hypothetical protein
MAANNVFRSSITTADVQAVSPALASYTKTAIADGVWTGRSYQNAIGASSPWPR